MRTNMLVLRNAVGGAVCGIAVLAIFLIYVNYRNKSMERLFREAAGYPSYFRDSSESTDAVRRLGKYQDKRSTALLLQIAMGHGLLINPETRDEAFRALRGRNDPTIGDDLATLLQPHFGLRSRQQVAAALNDIACQDECIHSILHYLERIANGELNNEDRTIFPPGAESWKADQEKDEQLLYRNLQSVLKRESASTLSNLSAIYGLGSDNPSKFGVALISQMNFREACPLLLESRQALNQRPVDFYRGPVQEVQTAIITLECK